MNTVIESAKRFTEMQVYAGVTVGMILMVVVGYLIAKRYGV